MLSFNTDIVIKGSKAEKYQELNTKYNFTFIDTYMLSGVLGFLNNKKDTNDANTNATANIPRTVLNSRSDKIDFLCEIIILNEELEANEEQAMKLAFEDSTLTNPKKLTRLETFNDYAMGGIDILYDMLCSIEKYGDPVDKFKNALDMYLPNEDIGKKTADQIFEEAGL